MGSEGSSSELFAPGAEAYYRKVLKLDEPQHRCNACGHTEDEGCGCPAHAFVSRGHCDRCEGTWLIKNACGKHPNAPVIGGMCGGCTQYPQDMKLPPPEGPEYTPCVCGHTEPEHAPDAGEGECWANNCECPAYRTKPDFELPPQPERRPPYAVAYSAGGHAYEALLPGDAVVSAVDGRLVIEHQGFPVLAIERVMPVAVQKEEGDD